MPLSAGGAGLPSTRASTVISEISPDERIRLLVVEHWDFVGRLLRHAGVRVDLDDAAQQVFIIVAQKLSHVEAGKERSFLAGCAMNVAARARRAQAKRSNREVEEASDRPAQGNSPEEAVDHLRRVARLDAILAEMSEDLRAAFVMYEIEEMTMREIADALAIPSGTVASRLRRARSFFEERTQP